jgi:hypothetical protein
VTEILQPKHSLKLKFSGLFEKKMAKEDYLHPNLPQY